MFIGEQLKKARKEKGLTQEQLASKIGVSVMTIRRLEANTREVKNDIFEKIAAALDIDIMRLAMDEETYKQWESSSIRIAKGKIETRMLDAFKKLNMYGKEIAAQRVEELTDIERYTAPEDPEQAKNTGEN